MAPTPSIFWPGTSPVKLSKKQKELLREFEKLSEEGCHPESEGWLAKAKSFLGGEPKAKN